jgi:hypothetical protein
VFDALLDVFLACAMLYIMGNLLDEVEKKPAAARAAWKIILLAVVATATTTGFLVSWRYSAARDGDKAAYNVIAERLKLRDDQIADLKTQVGTDSPTEIRKQLDDLKARVEKLGPPKLGEEAAARLSSVLKEAPGAVYISRDLTVPAVDRYAEAIFYAFKSAGWAVSGQQALTFGPAPRSGTGITIPNQASMTPKQSVILKAFREAGLPFDLRDDSQTFVEEGQHCVERHVDAIIRITQASD